MIRRWKYMISSMTNRRASLFVITLVIFVGYLGSKLYLSEELYKKTHNMFIEKTGSDVGNGDIKALVTLFTTFGNNPDKMVVFFNTIRNWSQIGPRVKLILFLPPTVEDVSSKLLSSAKSSGWAIIVMPRVSLSGKLFIKDMYLRAMQAYNTTFYSFVSGDILFDNGFMNTLRLVEYELPLLGTTMIIGRRTNAYVEKTRLVSSVADVSLLANQRGHLYRVDALDFFVTSRGYPWQQLRDVTVGRPGFDNYVAGLAVINKITVIDGTHTILALHQSVVAEDAGPDPRIPVYTDRYNIKVIGEGFDYNKGSTLMAGYETVMTSSGKIYLKERN